MQEVGRKLLLRFRHSPHPCGLAPTVGALGAASAPALAKYLHPCRQRRSSVAVCRGHECLPGQEMIPSFLCIHPIHGDYGGGRMGSGTAIENTKKIIRLISMRRNTALPIAPYELRLIALVLTVAGAKRFCHRANLVRRMTRDAFAHGVAQLA